MRLLPILLSAGIAIASVASGAVEPAKLKILIVDGQHNHAWMTSTPLLKEILEKSGRFTVDVTTAPARKTPAPKLPANATPDQKTAHDEKLRRYLADEPTRAAKSAAQWAQWRPNFAAYAAVVSNYNGELWPEVVRTAFTRYVADGGGFVSYHAANNAFPEWPEYNEMIGVGGWGGRTEKAGPYLRFRDGVWIRDLTPGPGGAHGPQQEFFVELRAPKHPIVRGLPARWLHAKDEIYDSLRGPAKNLTVLASAFSERSNEHEPILMTIAHGRGRVFHTTLGHTLDGLHGLGFQITLQRGTEWAATGKVTLAAPGPGALR